MNGSINGTHEEDKASSARKEALRLSERKGALEAEMDTIIESLTQNNGPGLTGNLVDAQGFPRADVDVVHVRQQRNRLARLKNDHMELSSQIENMLCLALPPSSDQAAEADHINSNTPQNAAAPAAPVVATSSVPVSTSATPDEPTAIGQQAPQPTAGTAPTDLRQAFAMVDIVSPFSPASEAGILVNDKIVTVGAVSLRSSPTSDHAMSLLPGLLQQHENRTLDIVIRRSTPDIVQTMNLTLTPRKWQGQGLLGCHIIPLEVSQEDPRYTPEVATAAANRSYPAAQ